MSLDNPKSYKIDFDNSNIKDIKALEISSCSNIEKVPYIKNLERINCYDNVSIKSIPNIVSLKFLSCSGSYISKIPNYKNLVELNCNDCLLLTEIPNI